MPSFRASSAFPPPLQSTSLHLTSTGTTGREHLQLKPPRLVGVFWSDGCWVVPVARLRFRFQLRLLAALAIDELCLFPLPSLLPQLQPIL
ncbi:hypothetical protein VTJ04DRAFT_3990 [Mycothermus thermophilus]|uniref:uncharacterized protein n=1 Tax=Humicola insolens TaxID=85995 RepID=UPI0037444AE6